MLQPRVPSSEKPAPADRSPAPHPVPCNDGDIILPRNYHPGRVFHMSAVMGAMALTSSSMAGLPRKPILLIFSDLQTQPVASVLSSTVPGGRFPLTAADGGAVTPPAHPTASHLPTAELTLALSVNTATLLSSACSFPRLPSNPRRIPWHITPPLLALKNTTLANITSSSPQSNALTQLHVLHATSGAWAGRSAEETECP